MLLTLVATPVRAQVAGVAEREETTAAASGGMKTVAVIAGEQFDSLIKDVTFLGTIAGRPEMGQMVEGGINFFTHGKGLQAIDRTKHWGVIVQTDGTQLLPVGCLPVKKLSDLLAVVTA